MGVVRDALSVFCTLAPAMPVRAPVRASGGLSTLAYALMPPSTFEAVKTRFQRSACMRPWLLATVSICHIRLTHRILVVACRDSRGHSGKIRGHKEALGCLDMRGWVRYA